MATILSAQCTDQRVNQVTPGLFKKYPTVTDLAHANRDELANDIRSTGFFNNKSKSLIGAAQTLLRHFGGQVPKTMDELLTVPGAARKTSNVVLGTAFGIPSGVVVDTHVHRVSRRLDLTRQSDPVKIEQDLMKILPERKWIQFSHQIIFHGRALCQARKPLCFECRLDPICYAKDKTFNPEARNAVTEKTRPLVLFDRNCGFCLPLRSPTSNPSPPAKSILLHPITTPKSVSLQSLKAKHYRRSSGLRSLRYAPGRAGWRGSTQSAAIRIVSERAYRLVAGSPSLFRRSDRAAFGRTCCRYRMFGRVVFVRILAAVIYRRVRLIWHPDPRLDRIARNTAGT